MWKRLTVEDLSDLLGRVEDDCTGVHFIGKEQREILRMFVRYTEMVNAQFGEMDYPRSDP